MHLAVCGFLDSLICTELSPVETDDDTNESNVGSSTTPGSNKPSKKAKPAAQSFAAIQALWQHRLPNAGLCGLRSLLLLLLLLFVCFSSTSLRVSFFIRLLFVV